ncbi:MAG: glycosyltransferase family 4 protein [Patescibacteria group bacterium]|nr:glycosyltransferase family 4 protein [Patescibacteria group bacterium]
MNEFKKTLLITLNFPPAVGGEQVYYYNFAKNLPPDKIVVLSQTQINSATFDDEQEFPIIRKNLINIPSGPWPTTIAGVIKLAASVKWLSLISNVKKLVADHNIELIASGQILPLGTLALLYKKIYKVPYIFFAHGLDIMLPQQFMRKKKILKKVIAQADGIIANSHYTFDELVALGADPKKIIVAYPCPAILPHLAKTNDISTLINQNDLTGKKILLTVGRLVERKGHDMVIKALPKIIAQIPNVIYLIAGDGPQKNELKSLVDKLGLNTKVKFLGALASEAIAELYQMCDLFIMPNRQLSNGDVEGFGIVFLEANMFGKPVIGGKNGGVIEAIIDGKTGLLVNPTNLDEIANASIKLLSDTAYAERLGLQGLERASNEFDWQIQTAKIKNFIGNL